MPKALVQILKDRWTEITSEQALDHCCHLKHRSHMDTHILNICEHVTYLIFSFYYHVVVIKKADCYVSVYSQTHIVWYSVTINRSITCSNQ